MHKYTNLGELMGDNSLIDALYQRHAPALFAFLRQHTASREDAEDLLLEVFVNALECAQLAELTVEQQRAWLWRVARNKVIDTYRRAARRPTLALEHVETELFSDDAFSPEQSALRQEEYRHLHVLLEQLTPLQRDILLLRFGDDLRCTEIAQAIGKKESTVRVLLMRTLRFLQTIYTHPSKWGKEETL